MTGQSGTHASVFKEEAFELLNDLEAAILEVEESRHDSGLIDRIFRALHTIKGSAAMFGYERISLFLHDIESVFDQVRSGKLVLSGDLVNLTLAASDEVRKMLEDANGAELNQERLDEINAAFRRLLQGPDRERQAGGGQEEPDAPSHPVPDDEAGNMVTYRVRFRPPLHIFLTGTSPLLLLKELEGLGICHVVAGTEGIPDLEQIDAENCYIYWDIILTTDKGVNAIRDIFIFVEDISEITIEEVDEALILEGEAPPKLGEILIGRGDVSSEDLHKVLQSKKRIGELLVESGVVSRNRVESALVQQEHVREIQEKKKVTEAASSLRVASEKLDKLVDMVGELVIAEARLNRCSVNLKHPELLSIAEDLERLTAELRENAMSIRMVPISTTFGRFKRLVHDLSGELGKEIEIVTEGGSTELDKTVIERLNDPLIHLIRNCVDHGIETPETRISAGKEAKGRITLSARYVGAHVVIDIEDDGAGLDREAIREKAIARNLITQATQLTDKDIFDLVFLPGFSTAKTVSNVSGRGVGMDVVKKSVEALRGSIEMKSGPTMGTSISIRLPLTLAIVEGLLVAAGPELFVLPVSFIEECVDLEAAGGSATNSTWNAWVSIRGALVPCIRLRDYFSIKGSRGAREQVIVVKLGGYTAGLIVDDIVGEIQAVIKGLGRVYRHTEGISGATVLGDGRIALILDAHQIVYSQEEREVIEAV